MAIWIGCRVGRHVWNEQQPMSHPHYTIWNMTKVHMHGQEVYFRRTSTALFVFLWGFCTKCLLWAKSLWFYPVMRCFQAKAMIVIVMQQKSWMQWSVEVIHSQLYGLLWLDNEAFMHQAPVNNRHSIVKQYKLSLSCV